MNHFIQDEATLQACVGKLPGPRDLKVIDHLDSHAVRWIAESPFLFVTVAHAQTADAQMTAAGAYKGVVRVISSRFLDIPLPFVDKPEILQAGYAFGSLFLIPGLDETLRVNGVVHAVEQGWARISVKECYLHCAKAFMRSDFWQTPDRDDPAPDNAAAFLQHSRFMALATVDQQLNADVSPKGDPAGKLLMQQDGQICFADRPGNRRIDSFRNILQQPKVAMLALIPGTNHLLRISGNASISNAPDLLAAFRVQDKTPHLVTCVQPLSVSIETSVALGRAELWAGQVAPQDIHAADIFKAHVKLNKSEGVMAKVARAAISIPGLMQKGLENDYKKNMY